MKRLIYLFIVFIFILSCKKEPEANYVLLAGKIENSEGRNININGYKFKKTIPVNEDGSFSDTLYLEEKGYYNVGLRQPATVFLKNGYELHLTADAKDFYESLSYTGEGAEVNNYLAEKSRMLDDIKVHDSVLYAHAENDFKAKLVVMKKASDSLLAAADTDKEFEAVEKDNIFYAYGTELLKYPSYHTYYAKKENFEPGDNFYDELKDVNYMDEAAYMNIPSYRQMLSQKFSADFSENYEESKSESEAFLATIESYPKGYMKDELMRSYIGFCLTTNEHMDVVYNTYMAETQNEEYKAKVKEKYEKIQNLVKGKPSPAFAYENYKGGKTSLEDLKGKYVYIDVWATWCGPCKREIPHLKQLEKDYHNSNIEFVSISIDTPDAYDTWKKMVKEEELAGIQLIADNAWQSQFVTDYAINGIPRFILIDPEGNIITADAPRPSNEKVRVLFNELKI